MERKLYSPEQNTGALAAPQTAGTPQRAPALAALAPGWAAARDKLWRIALLMACLGLPSAVGWAARQLAGWMGTDRTAPAGLWMELGGGLCLLAGLSLYLVLQGAASAPQKRRAAAAYAAQLLALGGWQVLLGSGWGLAALLLANALALGCWARLRKAGGGAAIYMLPQLVWQLLSTAAALARIASGGG